MGSSINVNVGIGFGGLPAIDKEQRNNMRFVKLEKDGKSLIYQTSLDESAKARTAQGKDPTGKPKPSTPAPVLRRDEPAAFRSQNDYMLLKPTEPPGANQWFDPFATAVLPLQKRGNYPTILTSGSGTNYQNARPTYYASGGPNNSSMLACDLVAANINQANYVQLRSYQQPAGRPDYKELTLQCYFKFGGPVAAQMPSPEIVIRIGGDAQNSRLFIFITLQAYNINTGVQKYLSYSIQAPTGYVYIYEGSGNLDDATIPMLRADVWHHCAITMKATGVGSMTAYAFFDGTLVGSVALPFGSFALNGSSNWADISFGQTILSTFYQQAQPVYIHGFKFEPRCLWTDNFTPLPNL